MGRGNDNGFVFIESACKYAAVSVVNLSPCLRESERIGAVSLCCRNVVVPIVYYQYTPYDNGEQQGKGTEQCNGSFFRKAFPLFSLL